MDSGLGDFLISKLFTVCNVCDCEVVCLSGFACVITLDEFSELPGDRDGERERENE
jgi:hypothetical protein